MHAGTKFNGDDGCLTVRYIECGGADDNIVFFKKLRIASIMQLRSIYLMNRIVSSIIESVDTTKSLTGFSDRLIPFKQFGTVAMI